MRTYEDSALEALCEKLKGTGEIHKYHDMIYHSGVNDCQRWETITTPKEKTGTIGYCDLERGGHDNHVTWEWMFEPDTMTFSDYSGSSVERANCQTFLEQHEETEGVYETTGGYGTMGVAITLSAITEEMIEILDALQDYPVIDDEALSALEMKLEDEDWDSWIKDDFRRALKKTLQLPDDDPEADEDPSVEEMIDAITDEKLYEFYRERCEKTNTNWYAESAVGGYVDIDALVKGVTLIALPEMK
jgi:hypothetical protein